MRADAGTDVGTGHVMRCLALGQAWLAHGGKAKFVSRCQGDALRRKIEATHLTFAALDKLHPDPDDLNTTLRVLDNIAAHDHQRPWLVLDGYHFDQSYQKALRATGHELLVIDDNALLPHYYASVLLNQNINADQLAYRTEADTLLLLGIRYVLLRPEFLAWRKWRRQIAPVATKVLVTMGGTDTDNATALVLRALELLTIEGLEIAVAVGPDNRHLDELVSIVRGLPLTVQFHRNPANMAELMAWSDMSVSAGGSTLWELAFMGLPSVTLVLAENQEGAVRRLEEQGVCQSAGWATQVDSRTLAERIEFLAYAEGLRRRFSVAGKDLVDGLGSQRVIQAMLSKLGGED